MKKIIQICMIAFAALFVAAASGCSARSAISADDFQKKAKSMNYTVAASTSASTFVKTAYEAQKGDTAITFYKFDTPAHAQSWYSTQNQSLTGNGQTVVDSDMYNKYTLTNGEIYYLIVRMDDTYVSCKTTIAQKGEAENFINSIKY